MEYLEKNRILIQLDKADIDGAFNAANKEAVIKFLDLTGYSGFDLFLEHSAVSYDYSLNQSIFMYVFQMELIK